MATPFETVGEPIEGKLRACAPMSFEDIAYTLGITRQRAQQIYDAALRKALRVSKERGINVGDLFHD